MSVGGKVARRNVSERWPLIASYVRVNGNGWVDVDFTDWDRVSRKINDSAVLATAYEQWAQFFDWYPEQVAGDATRRWLVEKWADSMAYSCRRSAAIVRGQDPGEAIPQSQRRPDLSATLRAAVEVAGVAGCGARDHCGDAWP